jgi:thermostable 8-oxoguanine DNA glycosylase
MIKRFTKRDLEIGRLILDAERIYPVVKENIFPKAVYWILSVGEKHEKQALTYYVLEHLGLLKPDAIIDEERFDDLQWAMKRIRFPNQKTKYLKGFSEYWLDSDIGDLLESDASNGHQKGFGIRKRLYDEAPGIGLKCASCLLNSCGYHYLVPIDTWVLKWLKKMGYEVPAYDFETNGGFNLRKYLPLEAEISIFAKEYGVCEAVFQATVWGTSTDQLKYYSYPVSAMP